MRKLRDTADSDYAVTILADLHALRTRIMEAWQQRAVMLTKEEQKELRKAIAETCSLLTDLTSSA